MSVTVQEATELVTAAIDCLSPDDFTVDCVESRDVPGTIVMRAWNDDGEGEGAPSYFTITITTRES